MTREERLAAMDDVVRKVGTVKKEGSNVVSFRCNARFQATIKALQEEFAPLFDYEPDDLPISTVVKCALEYSYISLIGVDKIN